MELMIFAPGSSQATVAQIADGVISSVEDSSADLAAHRQT